MIDYDERDLREIDEGFKLLLQLNHDPRIEKLYDLLTTINEELFWGELPIENITIEISDKYTRTTCMDTLITPSMRENRYIHDYKITVYKRSLRKSWNDIASGLEHECLHIFMHYNNEDFDDKDKDFVYMCGRLKIVCSIPERLLQIMNVNVEDKSTKEKEV